MASWDAAAQVEELPPGSALVIYLDEVERFWDELDELKGE